MRNGRCRMHGGKSPQGIASATFKTGKYSKHLPTRMLSAYEASREDPDLLSLTAELNVTDAKLIDLIQRVEHGDSDAWRSAVAAAFFAFKDANIKADKDEARLQLSKLEALIVRGLDDVTAWNGIKTWEEHRRRLVDSEQKRRVAMQQLVSAEQAMLMVTALTQAVRDHVRDPETLRAITEALGRIAPSSMAGS